MENDIFDLILISAVPLVMILSAIVIKIKKPSINNFYGFRTEKSVRSESNWNQGNNLLSKYWVKIGDIWLTLVLLLYFYCYIKSMTISSTILFLILMLQSISVILSIPFINNKIKE